MTFRPRHHPGHLYFITATIRNWHHVFNHPPHATIILDSLQWHRVEQRWHLFAFVLMPNHLHAIVQPIGSHTISSTLQSFGSFTAHRLLEAAHDTNDARLLNSFAGRQDQDHAKQHQVWQPIQAKNIFTPEFLLEKLEYLHNNPVAKQWQLAGSRSEYPYSSACYYDEGRPPIIEVDDVRKFVWSG